MKQPGAALLLIAAAVALRRATQPPFEVLETTYWQTLLPPLLGQFLAAYIVPQMAVLLAASCWKEGFRSLADRLLRLLSPAWVCPSLMLAAAVLFRRYGLYEAIFVSDEVCFNVHAICLASGRLGCAPPPYPDHFQYSAFYIGPKIWTGISFPGWPLLLAVGYLLGYPRLVSPILGAVTTLQLQALARRWYGTEAGALTGLLLLASPMFFLEACSDFSHLAALFWAANTLLCLERVEAAGKGRGWALLGGLCLGMLVSTRQLDAFLLLVALLGWRVLIPRESTRPDLTQIALVGLGVLPTSLLLFAQNTAVSGNPFVPAYFLTGEMSGQFSMGPVDRLALGCILFARVATWMVPGFLESIPSLRRGRGLFGLILLAGYTLGYGLPGGIEFGSRYLLTACVLLLPFMAGTICRSAARKSCIIPCLALSLFAAYPGEASSAMKQYRYQWALDDWLARSLPGQSLAFYRRLPTGPLGIARNDPDLAGLISVLALDPKENLKLRQHFADRPAFYLDWIPEQRRYQVTPFEEPHDINLDRICAGMNYANLRGIQPKALEQWAQIPPDSPFYEAARQNRIKLLNKLGRQQEAEGLQEPGRKIP